VRHVLTLETARPLRVSRANTGGFTLLVPALTAFVPVFGLAAAQGGYFPTAWGWASVPLLWTAAVAVIARARIGQSRPERVFMAALAAYAAWLALSVVWSVAPAQSVLEIERALVYLAAVVAVVLVSSGRAARHVLAGLLAAISLVALFSLATRLVPDRVGVYDGSGIYRLAEPIGYWNGLALFTAMGTLLALGFAARARAIAARAACGAGLVVLLPTMYFTFGRAAWIALGIGLLAVVAVDPRRLQFLVVLIALAPATVAAVLISSRTHALTHAGVPLALAAHDGHRLALRLAGLAAANAAISVGVFLLESRLRISRTVARVFALAVLVGVIAAGAGVLVRFGGPLHVVKAAYRSFVAPLPPSGGSLNERLLSFSGNGRAEIWRLAWDDAGHHPLLGAGAGTFERYFLAHQPADVSRVRDAHSLYLETLAEVGPFGLGLLILLLLTPLAALRRVRRHPLVPAAGGAYVAYLVHTGVDWDWELPTVTLVGLVSGVAILLAGRSERAPVGSSPRLRWGLAVGAVAAAAFAMLGLLGNSALSRSETAREHHDEAAAATDARHAHWLMPWSPAPWQALGRAQLAASLLPEARQSFRNAISIDPGDWQLWYDLAAATSGSERTGALRKVAVLYPRSDLVRSTTSVH
jgi:hypothetical protein